ncbi:hypothetical protein [Desulfogranum japonicum]|uniref:hypothetical protein n=1 Tax=Desulfogranum japonicum TaxID=231447 RepID=UPI00040B84E3|nr:hypothetical protein [Desulfogranum japonicum]
MKKNENSNELIKFGQARLNYFMNRYADKILLLMLIAIETQKIYHHDFFCEGNYLGITFILLIVAMIKKIKHNLSYRLSFDFDEKILTAKIYDKIVLKVNFNEIHKVDEVNSFYTKIICKGSTIIYYNGPYVKEWRETIQSIGCQYIPDLNFHRT